MKRQGGHSPRGVLVLVRQIGVQTHGRAMHMDTVGYAGSTTRTLRLDFEPPTELVQALQAYNDNVRRGSDEVTEVIVTIAGVRVGKVNLHARQWRHLLGTDVY